MEETYVEWLVRSTGVVEKRREEAGVEDWVAAQRRRYWRWAGHVARCNDGRWTQKLMKWTPQYGYRHRGHPLKRWTDDLDTFSLPGDFTRWVDDGCATESFMEEYRERFYLRTGVGDGVAAQIVSF